MRLAVGPTLDSAARVGVESTLSFGIGWPLDFKGRSHHFVQARGAVGGGLDRAGEQAVFLTSGELDYIYWAEPKLDVRFGMHVGLRKLLESTSATESHSFGAHAAVLPIALTWPSSWMVPQIVIGPELRAEYVWTDATHPSRTIVSLPLVIEGNLLAAGD
ncbi:MAG: hypothetical protein U0441_25875 [Polyangiaceae bacterium]